MKSKSRKGIIIFLILLTAALAIYTGYLFISSRVMIITLGLNKYKLLKMACLILTILSVAITVVISIIFNVKEKNRVDYTVDDNTLTRANKIIEEIKSFGINKFGSKNVQQVKIILEDIAIVLKYYTSLESEVQASGLFELSDADDILGKVLNSMLLSTEQMLRATRVLYVRDGGELTEAVNKCYTDVHNMKSKALDFINSILNYMNNKESGEDTSVLEDINVYKEVILEELDLVNKYLK